MSILSYDEFSNDSYIYLQPLNICNPLKQLNLTASAFTSNLWYRSSRSEVFKGIVITQLWWNPILFHLSFIVDTFRIFLQKRFFTKNLCLKKKLFRQTSTIFLNLMSWKLTKVALLFFNLPQSLQVFAHLTRIRFSYLWQRPSVLNNSQFSGLSSSKQNSLFAVKP